MDREDAIEYLEKKGIVDDPYTERKMTKDEETEIKKVMKSGKIYGDPLVKLDD